jgi:hypothetical protein
MMMRYVVREKREPGGITKISVAGSRKLYSTSTAGRTDPKKADPIRTQTYVPRTGARGEDFDQFDSKSISYLSRLYTVYRYRGRSSL